MLTTAIIIRIIYVYNTFLKGIYRKDGNKMKANFKLRNLIISQRLKYWEVAKQIGIADTTFSRWLRTPLNDERKRRVEKAINDLTKVKE